MIVVLRYLYLREALLGLYCTSYRTLAELLFNGRMILIGP